MSEVTVKLTKIGAYKINVIKAIREITNLGLKEAKDFIEAIPKIVAENVPQDKADIIVKKLKDAGAEVEITVLSAATVATSSIASKNTDVDWLVSKCFPKKPSAAVELQKFVDEYGLSIGWFVGLSRMGLVKG